MREPLEGIAGGERALPGPHAAQPLGHVEIQHERQIGHDAVGGEAVQLGDDRRAGRPARIPGRRRSSRRTGRRGRPGPAASPGRITRWTCSARLAAKRSASVSGRRRGRPRRALGAAARRGACRRARRSATTGTPRSASQARRRSTWVDLPAPSTPSTVIRRPRGPSGCAAAMVPSRYHTRAGASRAGGARPQQRKDEAVELGDLALRELARRTDRLDRQDDRRDPPACAAGPR